MGLGNTADFEDGSESRSADKNVEWAVTYAVPERRDAQTAGGLVDTKTSTVPLRKSDNAEKFAESLTNKWNSDHSERGYRATRDGPKVTFDHIVEKMAFSVDGGTMSEVSTGGHETIAPGIKAHETE